MQPIHVLRIPCVFLVPSVFLLLVAPADCQTVRGEPPLRFQARTVETEAVLWWARALGDVNGNGLTDILLQDNNGHGGALRWYETRDGGTGWTLPTTT